MTYYLASLLFGEDGTLTVTYHEASSTPGVGLPHPDIRNALTLSIPSTLVPTLRPGRTCSSPKEVTQATPEGGAASTERAAGGEEMSPRRKP